MYESNLVVKLGHNEKPAAPVQPQFTTPGELLANFNRYHRIGFWEFDVTSKDVFGSKEAFAIHGIDSAEGFISREKALSFYVKEDVAKVEDILRKSIAVKQGFQFKLRITRSDNQTRVVEAIGDIKHHPDTGNIIVYGSFRDITSQTGFENSRVGQQDLIARMLKTLPIPAMITDQKLRYIFVNQRFSTEFNLTEEQMQPLALHADAFPDMPPAWLHAFSAALSGKQMALTHDVYQRATGEKYLLDWVMQPWVSQTGEIGGVVMFAKIHKFFPRLLGDALLSAEAPPQLSKPVA
jgi:PAS domain-containing protein